MSDSSIGQRLRGVIEVHGELLAMEIEKVVRAWAEEVESTRPKWPYGEPPPGMMPAFVPMPPGQRQIPKEAKPVVEINSLGQPRQRQISEEHKQKLRANLSKAWKERSAQAAAARAAKEREAEDAMRQKVMRELEEAKKKRR